MSPTGILAALDFISLVFGHGIPRDFGLCSQVFQMHEYCLGVNATPVVDASAIYRRIDEKFAEYQKASDARLERCEARIENLERELTPLLRTDCGKVLKEYAITINETGGVFDIYTGYRKLRVFCDMTTDGGRWLVFQRRMDGSVDFYRDWDDYVNGFGNKDGEFWLGLEKLHQLTSSANYELRIDMEDWEGNKSFAKYSTFKIGDAASYYRLTTGKYSGNAGDSLTEYSSGQSFTTKDRDHDAASGGNCAVSYKGAWWYKDCHQSNLNGFYFQDGVHESYADGIEWKLWKGYYYSLKFTEMKMRIHN